MYYMFCRYLLGQLPEHSVPFGPALLHKHIVNIVNNHFEQINDDVDDDDDLF